MDSRGQVAGAPDPSVMLTVPVGTPSPGPSDATSTVTESVWPATAASGGSTIVVVPITVWKAPLSHPVGGRTPPRWSVAEHKAVLSTSPRAGFPAKSAIVSVGPPLSASGPIVETTPSDGPKPHELSLATL